MVAATAACRTARHRDPMTMGAYINFHPGQITRYAPLIWVEEHGRAARPVASGPVHFADEHLSSAYPDYMNGDADRPACGRRGDGATRVAGGGVSAG